MTSKHTIEGRNITVETTEVLNLKDVSITGLTVRWLHGIYGTREEARFTLVSTAHAEDVLVDHADGLSRRLDAVRFALDRVLVEHMLEES